MTKLLKFPTNNDNENICDSKYTVNYWALKNITEILAKPTKTEISDSDKSQYRQYQWRRR